MAYHGSKLTQSNMTGWTMALPAVVLVAAFIILPFFFAFAFSFTNQRLISPNPTEFVGLANYHQLLDLGVLTIEPELDADGQILLDQNLLKNERLNYKTSGIYCPSYLVESQGRFRGSPKRSFRNGRFQNGYSDHFPVYAIFDVNH